MLTLLCRHSAVGLTMAELARYSELESAEITVALESLRQAKLISSEPHARGELWRLAVC